MDNENINEIVRQNIITYMNQKKISTSYIVNQYNTDKKLDTSTGSIYNYLRGSRKISLNICNFFSKVLNIPIENLFNKDYFDKFKDLYKKPYKEYKIKEQTKKIKEIKFRDKVIYYYRNLSSNKKTLQQLSN